MAGGSRNRAIATSLGSSYALPFCVMTPVTAAGSASDGVDEPVVGDPGVVLR